MLTAGQVACLALAFTGVVQAPTTAGAPRKESASAPTTAPRTPEHTAAGAPSPAEAAPATAPPATAPTPTNPNEVESRPSEPGTDVVGTPDRVTAILPCGLRVAVARDTTFSVAAVVLAVERGSADDGPELAGLHYALALHLAYQGNRELAPGGATRTTLDIGGHVALATGPAQVRFETLVPLAGLDDVLDVEAWRLRAPRFVDERWEGTLDVAAKGARSKLGAPWDAIGLLWSLPYLSDDGRGLSKAVRALPAAGASTHMAAGFDYSRATLTVVSPLDPQVVLDESIAPRFAALPYAKPAANRRFQPLSKTRTTQGATARPQRLYAIEDSPTARLQADATCRALRGAGLRCRFDDLPGLPFLTLTATRGSIDTRLDAALKRLAAQPRRWQRHVDAAVAAWATHLDTPLERARELSRAGQGRPTQAPKSPTTLDGRAHVNLTPRPKKKRGKKPPQSSKSSPKPRAPKAKALPPKPTVEGGAG